MLTEFYGLARAGLFALPPEDAHAVTLRLLERGVYPRDTRPDPDRIGITVAGLRFSNPVGIAAGFDKDARVPAAVLGMGCGFAEVGTITPRPQEGNPQPRVFRLVSDRGLINRLGFNNGGHAAALERLRQHRPAGIIAINIGANKDSADRTADYVLGLAAFYDFASLFTINISSPNTPGLRDLQAPAALDELLGRVMAERRRQMDLGKPKRPICVKLSPDIAEDDIPAIVERLKANAVDLVAVSNTTLSRPNLTDPQKSEAGGLSGRPLFQRSTVMLARIHQATGGTIPLVGIGGIDTPQRALAKIEAGASLIQLYTGLIYEGPGLIRAIKEELDRAVAADRCDTLAGLVGRRAQEWAARPLMG